MAIIQGMLHVIFFTDCQTSQRHEEVDPAAGEALFRVMADVADPLRHAQRHVEGVWLKRDDLVRHLRTIISCISFGAFILRSYKLKGLLLSLLFDSSYPGLAWRPPGADVVAGARNLLCLEWEERCNNAAFQRQRVY